MASATTARVLTRKIEDAPHALPVLASEVIVQGCIVQKVLSTGYAKNGVTATGCRGVGVARPNHKYGSSDATWDATGLSSGDIYVDYDAGVHGPFVNSGSSITVGMEGEVCYIVDNQTVHADNGANTRSPAGRVYRVATEGVYVDFCEDDITPAPEMIITIPVTLSSVVSDQPVGKFIPGFAGQIKRLDAVVVDGVATSAKLAAFQPRISGTAISGGILSAYATVLFTAGNFKAGTTVQALNSFVEGQAIDLYPTGVTTFSDGRILLQLYLGM